MAGFVLDNTSESGASVECPFHIDTHTVRERILEYARDKRVIILQLDGDELEASLWGLENYKKGQLVVAPTVFDNNTVTISPKEE